MSQAQDWDRGTLQRRIADPASRRRWAGGSPDTLEIEGYAALMPPAPRRRLAVVLGMTPEVRTLALNAFDRVISIDRSVEAHAIYADWVPADARHREQRIIGDWSAPPPEILGCVDAVFGGGVLGNCADGAAAIELLRIIRTMIHNAGTMITRHACYPDGFAGMRHRWEDLLAAFGRGDISDEELGFGLRLAGHVDVAWDDGSCLLDCGMVYRRLDAMAADGTLSPEIWAFARRYQFAGMNWIPDESRWQQALTQAGWRAQRHELTGREWYRYYPLYSCQPVQADA